MHGSTQNEPFFVVGALRSGTTMLRLMLDHHPRIGCFGEFEYSIDLLDDPDGWPDGKTFVEWLSNDRRFNAKQFHVDSTLEYKDIALNMLEQMHDKGGKEVTGAVVHRHFSRLHRLWPMAKFIYVCRDGRDVSRSCVSMGWAGNVWKAAGIWIDAENSWNRLTELTEPAQRIETSYEEMVLDTKTQLTRICKFLGDEYDPKMLQYDRDSTYSLPDPQPIQQWRRKLSPRQISMLESRIGVMLQNRGYELSGIKTRLVGKGMRGWLCTQDFVARHVHRMKRYGFKLWAIELLARRMGFEMWTSRLRQRINEIDGKYLR
jgi:hypothetical protein